MAAEDVRQALQGVLLADATLATLGLGTYGGGLAVFAQERVPEDAPLPYVNVAGLIAGTDFDTKSRPGAEEFYDVVIADRRDINTPPIRITRLARRVREVLHRCRLEVEGMNVIRVRALPPIEQDSTTNIAARVVSVGVLYQGASRVWP